MVINYVVNRSRINDVSVISIADGVSGNVIVCILGNRINRKRFKNDILSGAPKEMRFKFVGAKSLLALKAKRIFIDLFHKL